jgi:hypothetical protein
MQDNNFRNNIFVFSGSNHLNFVKIITDNGLVVRKVMVQ